VGSIVLVFWQVSGSSDFQTIGIVVAVTAPVVIWTAFSSWMLARRVSASHWPATLARIWITLAVLVVPLSMLSEEAQLIWFAFALVAAPYVLSAAADIGGNAWIRVAAGALLGSAAAAAGLLVRRWGGGWDLRPENLEHSWWSAELVEDASLAEAAWLAGHAGAGALLAALGLLVQRARSMTAVPLDHPLVTELPYLPAAAPAPASARTSVPGASPDGGATITSSPPASPSATSTSPDVG
jgi:hypothetical protein